MAFVNIIDIIYPVGAFYISSQSTSPATLFGGTWTSMAAGRCIRSASEDYPQGLNSGSETMYLNNKNMPGTVWQTDGITGWTTLNKMFSDGSTFGMNSAPSSTTGYEPVSIVQPVQNQYIWYRLQ